MGTFRETLHKKVLSASDDSLAHRLRNQRTEEFLRRFPDLSSMRVIDLGGTVDWWLSFPVRPDSVTIVNLEIKDSKVPHIKTHQGDACSSSLTKLGNFDLVFSNSLIEHVGGPSRRLWLAQNIQTLADNWWVQTPYRYFPIEPHRVFPGQQWLPLAARARISRQWHLGHMRSDTYIQAVNDCLNTELLSLTEMRFLFANSEIWKERFMGLTKSIVAIHSSSR